MRKMYGKLKGRCIYENDIDLFCDMLSQTYNLSSSEASRFDDLFNKGKEIEDKREKLQNSIDELAEQQRGFGSEMRKVHIEIARLLGIEPEDDDC